MGGRQQPLEGGRVGGGADGDVGAVAAETGWLGRTRPARARGGSAGDATPRRDVAHRVMAAQKPDAWPAKSQTVHRTRALRPARSKVRSRPPSQRQGLLGDQPAQPQAHLVVIGRFQAQALRANFSEIDGWVGPTSLRVSVMLRAPGR